MENRSSMTKIMLTYGLVLGIIGIIVHVTNYAFGNIYDPHWLISLIYYVIFIGAIVYGVKAFKTVNNGFLKLSEAIKIAVGIALIAGIIGAVYNYIFTHFIEPDFIANQMEVVQEKMLEKFPDMDESVIEQQIEMSKKFNTPFFAFAMSVAGSMIMGLIVGLVAGLIMKKDETQFN